MVQGEAEGDPLMILEPVAAPDGMIGRLQSLTATPGSRVIVEAKEGRSDRLTLRVEGQPLDAAILPAGEVTLTVSDANIDGWAPGPEAGQPRTLRLALAPDHPIMQLQGGRRSFAITAGVDTSEALTLLASAQVQSVQFKRQGANGQLESAILGQGTVTYPEQSEVSAQAVSRGDFLELAESDPWLVEKLELRSDGSGLQVRLVGEPREMVLVSGGLTRDLRLTLLETLWNNAQVAVLVSIAVWATSISAGAYRLYREFVTGTER
jgi:type IV secretory pathway TrbD component